MSVDLTREQLDALFEKSKDDRAIIVGSEVRQLIGMIRRLQADAERAMSGRNFVR